MKAVQSHSYGSHLNLSVETIVKPVEIPKGKIMIETQSVALAPGDARVLSGDCRKLNGPPSFPYIPGGDLCGVVVDMGSVDPDTVQFSVGDRVAARFSEGPRDALAEYALIKPAMCGKVPDSVSSEDAAALVSSATPALHLSKRITENEKVLVIGAGGGVGSHLCQFLRLRGVKYVAGVSQNVDRLLNDPISCDDAIDYTKKDVFDPKEWGMDKDGTEPFDTIIDLAGGGWPRLLAQSAAKEQMIVKAASEGGRYLTTTPDEAIYKLGGIWDALKIFLFTSLWRAIYSRLTQRKSLPKYTYAMSLDNDISILKETMSLAEDKKLEACIDQRGPFNFTTEGVRDAFELLASRHAKGKVVIQVANSTDRKSVV